MALKPIHYVGIAAALGGLGLIALAKPAAAATHPGGGGTSGGGRVPGGGGTGPSGGGVGPTGTTHACGPTVRSLTAGEIAPGVTTATVTTASGACLRSSPEKTATNSIGYMPRGTIVYAELGSVFADPGGGTDPNTAKGWQQVRTADGTAGFVAAALIQGPTTLPGPQPTAGIAGVVTPLPHGYRHHPHPRHGHHARKHARGYRHGWPWY